MKLSLKSGFIIAFVVLCFISIIFWVILKMNNALSNTRYETAKGVAEVGKSILEYYAKEAREGRMTLEQAQNEAKEAIKSIRYEGTEYLWINDTTLPYPKMIMHPINSALDGKVLDSPKFNVAMGKSQNLFQAMVEVCKKSGSGFVDYLWNKPGQPEHLLFPKISYVILFAEWDWIIGSGVYVDNVREMLFEVFTPVVVFSFIMVIIIGFALIILVRLILKSIRLLMYLSKKLSDGDLTERIELQQKDEIGILVSSLNTTADNLEKLISEVVVSAQNLSQAVQEISSGNENLSQRTSEQASSLEEVASTIEEATASIRQNAENAIEAKKLTDAGAEKSAEGGRVAQGAVDAINEINASSKKIGEIIGVINEIAFQTNLLALNAAVEAARAGEQGRGFAVVAGEVRNLAQRSAAASKEISDLIRDSLEKVAKGTEMVNRSGATLAEIVEAAKSTAQLISEIAAASEEQKRGVDQINIAISELDTMTQQNAALVEETASASEEMASQAQELMSMMERFKIRQEVKKDIFEKKHKELHLQGGRAESAKPAAKAAKAVKVEAKAKDLKGLMADDGFEEF